MKVLRFLLNVLGLALALVAVALVLYTYWLSLAYFLIAVTCLASAGVFLEGANRCGP